MKNRKQIPFDFTRWGQENIEVETILGQKVVSIYSKKNSVTQKFPLIIEEESGKIDSYKIDGTCSFNFGITTQLVMYETPKRLSGWVNVDKDKCIWHYATKELADECRNIDRLACIDLSQFFEGEGL